MTTRTRPIEFPEATLTIVRWSDPVFEAHGHPIGSDYIERAWLPIVGPTVVVLLRNLDRRLTTADNAPVTIDPVALAHELGVGMRGGAHGPLWNAIKRAARFGAIRRTDQTLMVRACLAPLTPPPDRPALPGRP